MQQVHARSSGHQTEQFSYDDILLLSHKNIFQLATGTKEESMKLQDIVSYCCVRVLFRIQQAALIKLDELTVHPSGTYLIQGLALKSSDFRQTAIQFFKENFSKFASNQEASRTLSFFAKNFDSFREIVIYKLQQSPSDLLLVNPGVFVAISALECASEQELLMISSSINTNLTTWVQRRISRRVLLVVIQLGSIKVMDNIFKTLEKQFTSELLYQSYITGHIVSAFLDKQYKPAEKLVISTLKSNPTEMVSSPIFSIVISRKEHKSLSVGPFKKAILQALLNISSKEMSIISSTPVTYGFYSSLVSCLSSSLASTAGLRNTLTDHQTYVNQKRGEYHFTNTLF